jgi:GntR family transcriptional regulator
MLTRRSPLPLYRQFKERLLRDIESGTRPAHAQLPSEREWVKSLGVSRITVRQALSDLVQLGYLYSVPGKGFFVAERRQARELNAFLSFTAGARARGEEPASKLLGSGLLRADASLAQALAVAAGAEVVWVKRLRLANGIPMMVQEAQLAHARCPGLLQKDLSRQSLFELLRETYGVVLTRAETTITARLASEKERRWLELPGRGVVLVADQLSFTSDGSPIERALSIIHPERHPLSLVQRDGGRSLVGSG